MNCFINDLTIHHTYFKGESLLIEPFSLWLVIKALNLKKFIFLLFIIII